ncbi:MAG: hypothetical protein ABI131_03195 [Nostocoides sp.]
MNDDDPVEEFFTRERRDIHPLPGDDEHWTALVDAHRRSRRSRWTGFAAGAAAAAVIVGGVGYTLRPSANGALPGSHTASSTTRSPSPSGSPSSSAATGSTATSTPRPTTRPVPSDFVVLSVSNAGSDTVFALGTTTSNGTGLPAVARSTDNGKTWLVVASLPGASTPGRQVTGQVGNDTSFTQIRMASQKVGYIFGGSLMRTTDGGFHWYPYAVPGQDVLALETDGKNLAIASTTGSCDGLTCSGDLLVTSTSVTADSVATPTWTLAQSSPIRSVSFAWQNGGLFLTLQTTQARSAGPIGAKGFQPAVLPGCQPGTSASNLVVPASGGTMFALCPGGGAAGSVGFGVASSTDGVAWSGVSAADSGALTLVSGPFLSVAASDGQHLVAVSGGSPDVHGSMRVSSDGGVTWGDAKKPPTMPDRGWYWVGSPGGGQFYAVPAPSSGAYWLSTDRGATWSKVQVARAT